MYHEAWDYIDVLKENMNSGKAIKQLGTSGSGNHFVEWGVLEVPYQLENVSAGIYVALMSHSGSRGTGAAVCSTYSKIAKELHPELAGDPLTRDLGWLDLDTDAGREYWMTMNVMGDYAKAIHDCIHHKLVWKETHSGRDVIVHRKGSPPKATLVEAVARFSPKIVKMCGGGDGPKTDDSLADLQTVSSRRVGGHRALRL